MEEEEGIPASFFIDLAKMCAFGIRRDVRGPFPAYENRKRQRKGELIGSSRVRE